MQTDGVNFEAIWALGDIVDLNRLASNDINAILQTYGVEACRAAIVQQIAAVFNVYGIKVNKRHTGLLADYMTFQGGYKPLNRSGIESCVSPIQKISFETSVNFLAAAALHGELDHVKSPSARIVFGNVAACGTGAFECRLPLE